MYGECVLHIMQLAWRIITTIFILIFFSFSFKSCVYNLEKEISNSNRKKTQLKNTARDNTYTIYLTRQACDRAPSTNNSISNIKSSSHFSCSLCNQRKLKSLIHNLFAFSLQCKRTCHIILTRLHLIWNERLMVQPFVVKFVFIGDYCMRCACVMCMYVIVHH